MRFRIERLEAHSLDKLRLRHANIARLQQYQPEIVVRFREIPVPAHEFTEDIGRASGIVLLAEDQSQLYPGVSVLGIETDGFMQLSSGFLETPRLLQREAQIVVCLRQIRIGHHRLPELLERAFAIVLAPIEQSEARVGLRIVRFQLQRFLIGRQGTCCILLALPNYAQIIMAGRQLGTLLDGGLKKCQRIVELLLLQRFHALESEIFRLRQARPELMQGVQIIQLLFRRAGFALSAQSDTQAVVRLFEIRLQLDRPPERRDCASRVAAGF